MTLTPWIALPRRVLSAFGGRSSLPIHELEKEKVQKPYAHVRPLPDSSENLSFSAWRLAHAVKKADCARWPSTPVLWSGAAGFLLENAHLFDWSKSEFTLHDEMAKFYADFTGSGLAGRVAQGMALLFLEAKGYAYVGRFETEWKKRATAQNKSWPAGKNKAPDFIAENEKNEWILAESKGGFVSPDGRPNIKGALNEGLTQLNGWDRHIIPQPIKSFAIGTFLRESGDASDETSVIAFVDPEPDAPADPVEFPRDAVRRANYASWLSLMGLDDEASRVRTGLGEPQRRRIPVIEVRGRKYAVSVASVSPEFPDFLSLEFLDHLLDWPFFPFGLLGDGIRVELVGLELNIMQILGSAPGSPNAAGLMELKPREPHEAPMDSDGGGFYGSILSDGSLLGELRKTRARRRIPDLEWIEVEL